MGVESVGSGGVWLALLHRLLFFTGRARDQLKDKER